MGDARCGKFDQYKGRDSDEDAQQPQPKAEQKKDLTFASGGNFIVEGNVQKCFGKL